MSAAQLLPFREIGEKVTIYDPVTIIRPDLVTLKSNIIISEFAYLAAGQGAYFGSHIHLATQTTISGGGLFVAEDFVGICSGVRIITGTEDVSGGGLTIPTIPLEFRSFYRSYVVLGKHSFIGTNVVIHPGVTIGEGAVVASGSVVTKDLAPWGLYMGVPARRVKDRPREKMLELEKQLMEKYPYDASDFSDIIAQCTKK